VVKFLYRRPAAVPITATRFDTDARRASPISLGHRATASQKNPAGVLTDPLCRLSFPLSPTGNGDDEKRSEWSQVEHEPSFGSLTSEQRKSLTESEVSPFRWYSLWTGRFDAPSLTRETVAGERCRSGQYSSLSNYRTASQTASKLTPPALAWRGTINF
jgi:hypothetical protein